jgi:hypothetical protein
MAETTAIQIELITTTDFHCRATMTDMDGNSVFVHVTMLKTSNKNPHYTSQQ